MKKSIVALITVLIIFFVWGSIAYTDYAKVAISFDKPKFCIAPITADDGGSGNYYGLGYSFFIDGHLDAEDGFQVDKYTYKIFGFNVKQDEASPNKG